MSLSDPPTENNTGHYSVDGITAVRPDGSDLVQLGDSFGPTDSPFFDLSPGDSVIVAEYCPDAGDALMIEVVGSEQMQRIEAATLDRLLGSRLEIE